MDWYQIEDMIFESEETKFENIKCPDCNHILSIKKDTRETMIKCLNCGITKIYDLK